ncbi:MAG: serine phosphatase [Verrucomicrobiales bacterium]|nr:serine phosphatase [Verrucomicrobiales bacterium]
MQLAADKKELFSTIRHELRTPLNHIIGYSELLAEEASPELPASFHESLQQIHHHGRAMLGFINEIFDENKSDQERESSLNSSSETGKSVTEIVSFAEKLKAQVIQLNKPELVEDIHKIHSAALSLLSLIEKNLLISLSEPTVKSRARARKGGPSKAKKMPDAVATHFLGKILVIDDDKANRDLLARRLRNQGHKVFTSGSATEALKQITPDAFDILLVDVVMPGLSGIDFLMKLKEDDELRHIPIILISGMDDWDVLIQCIEQGAEDYLTKPFDPVLLKARIGSCLEKKYLRDQEHRVMLALKKSQERLAGELNEAARYVRSLLPLPLRTGVLIDHHLVPSSQLGGDAYGYHWVDNTHLCIYLIDICGHGVGAALLSSSIVNVLRAHSLPANFLDPAAILSALNLSFPMDQHNNMYFTAWYGVFDSRRNILSFASGGHPPALLVQKKDETVVSTPLTTRGPVVGGFPESKFSNSETRIEAGDHLYVFSDGVYEIQRPDGSWCKLQDLTAFVTSSYLEGKSSLEPILAFLKKERGIETFEDDVSLMECRFDLKPES